VSINERVGKEVSIKLFLLVRVKSIKKTAIPEGVFSGINTVFFAII
jgi:hypothetical protein